MMQPLKPVGRFARDRKGVAAVECAFVAPILILAYFGMAEICGAMMAERKASHVASAIADLTAQYASLQPSDIDNFFVAGNTIMSPSSTTGLQMRISVVQENAGGTASTVTWSCASSNWTANPVGTAVVLPASLVTANQSVVMSEVKYTYTSPVTYMLPSAFNYSDKFYLRPRLVDPIPAPSGC
jgi:Flp pilus assembly protein TadG